MRPLSIALVGNPNSGKTALFNRLTGSRQKVANYAGVTVERKEGEFVHDGRVVKVLDLPGAYSLNASSPDEAITRDICLGTHDYGVHPDLLVCVVDATNLRLHLRFAFELRALGKPMLVALNMMDAAAKRGIDIDLAKLEQALGVPVVPTVAVAADGAEALKRALADGGLPLPPIDVGDGDHHQSVRRALAAAVSMPRATAELDERLDRVLLHPLFGLLSLAVILFLMFQAVYAWAAPFQDGISAAVAWLSAQTSALLPDGILRSLLQDGIFAGLGTVLEFLPQILILFAFILALEETGYLPRAAFLLDRLMFACGLTGRSFIPLLSSYACAVPGIMATRSIQDPRDRLATILVAPLTTCSARLPVYALLIGAFIPEQKVLGWFNLQGLVLFALYLSGILAVFAVAWVLKLLNRQKSDHALLLELPSYRLPNPRDLAIGLWDRARIFLRRVGGIILTLTVLLWFLSTFPAPPEGFTGPAIDYSFAGRLGHLLAPVFAPIGFNWQIVLALIPGMAAREVAVSGLATVYALSDDEAGIGQLGALLAADWSLATALSVLTWYVFAPQCISTIATIKRETGSWKVTGFAVAYLFALAYGFSLLVYQTASALLA
ncbi:ferrous iron transporter B [Arenimonas maotaiensis]|uniref:Fe(2+) transporter FeoB n=1 Tax=Arenimonas maotaiensis TaxID=1446479 RepID=A0A917CRS6_9GAMM|nr:ferrous iron transporter B [Arenimonas maotaiensis]GGF96762.1 ferrous iron transporter B [Arenimonas maotaiensis]